MDEERVTPTPENPIPDVDAIKPGIPSPAWPDEGGGGGGTGGVLSITATSNDETGKRILDKTWKEIDTALRAGIVCIIFYTSENATDGILYANEEFITATAHFLEYEGEPESFAVYTVQNENYSTLSENGYPSQE